MNVLVTGGLGYIGSHVCVELLDNGYGIVVVDNLSNSKKEVKDKIEKISGKSISFYKFDICNLKKLNKVFKANKIDFVVHCAGYKAVGESVKNPLKYFENNLDSTFSLLEAMKNNNVNNLVFSSSATVYSSKNKMPLKETSLLGTNCPYGRTKLMIEQVLEDYVVSNPKFKAIILRYFNPVGAHKSGLIGENPNGIPNNLMPFISKVACGKLDKLNVFGNDYDTPDGTGVRDYIHVVDLAKGHEKAVSYFAKMSKQIDYFNLGTGKGTSVLEMIKAYNNVCGNKVKYKISPCRPGDISTCYCCPQKAYKILNWTAKLNIDDMCKSSYDFENKNK